MFLSWLNHIFVSCKICMCWYSNPQAQQSSSDNLKIIFAFLPNCFRAFTSYVSCMEANVFFVTAMNVRYMSNHDMQTNHVIAPAMVYPSRTHWFSSHLTTSHSCYLQPSSPGSQYESTSWLLQVLWLSARLALYVCVPDVCLLDVICAQ